jgi:hypothetical protein
LAQFYAGLVCEKLENRLPSALDAYRKLLQQQNGAYTVHNKWIEENDRPCEVIRISMIECRSRGILDYGEFAEVLDRQREQITGGKEIKGKGQLSLF